MTKERTQILGYTAIACTLVGVLGMIMLYRGALSPCLHPLLQGAEGFDAGFPIGKTIDGRTITMDILSLTKRGPAFIAFSLLWLAGAILIRTLMGWGDLLIPSRQVKILGMAGAVFQCLGSFMFLYSAWAIVNVTKDHSVTEVAATFGLTLRSVLSGLTTFGLGNVMTAVFLKFAISGPSTTPSSRKRRIVSCVSFVPMAIALVALVNAFVQTLHPEAINSPVLAAIMVGVALPMLVGSIPLFVNTKAIPRE